MHLLMALVCKARHFNKTEAYRLDCGTLFYNAWQLRLVSFKSTDGQKFPHTFILHLHVPAASLFVL